MTNGDCLIVAKANGRFDVFMILVDGSRESVRENISDIHSARKIARITIDHGDHDVFHIRQHEPDSPIKLDPPNPPTPRPYDTA